VDVAAFVLGGPRPGHPDPLSEDGDGPLVVRAVLAVLAAGIEDVTVVDHPDRAGAVQRACTGLPVHLLLAPPSHAGQRPGAPRGDASVAVLVDGASPDVPPAVLGSLLTAVADGAEAAVPVQPLTDTVKRVDADRTVLATPDRDLLRVVRSPYVVRGDLLPPLGAAALLPALLLDAGLRVVAVPA
jgi:2-C-methyl-D-erythritol 4-phosphate cytidylyltransferase